MLNSWDEFDFKNLEKTNQNNDLPAFPPKEDLWLKFAENISEQPEEKLAGTTAFMKDALTCVLEFS